MLAYAAGNKKGSNTVVLNLEGLSTIADFFVITSARTGIQVKAIVQEIERVCVEEKIRIYHTEGLGQSSWVLLDLGDVMVHVFTEVQRRYYDLESLWKAAKRIPLPKL